jgi:hypothetical protein
VTRHAGDERRPSTVIVARPSAAEIVSILRGVPVRSWDEQTSGETGTRTLLEVVAPGEEEQEVAALSELLGDTDVAILLFSEPPEMLPVGVVTDTLTRHRLTVLEAVGSSHRSARTAVVASRDPQRRQRAYLTGAPIPDDEAGRLRHLNEWVVEGLQLRSRVQLLERRLQGQDAELSQARKERRLLEQEPTEATDLASRLRILGEDLTATQEALAASELECAVSQKSLVASERSLVEHRANNVRPAKIRKAARLLRVNPVKGSGRIVRAVARSWRR